MEKQFEKHVLRITKEAIEKAIIQNLTGFNSPLIGICKRVILEHEREIEHLFNNEVSALLNSKDFKNALKNAVHHKIGTLLIKEIGGEIEKRVNELRQNAATRAKITLAIDKIMEECTFQGEKEM